MLGGSRAIGVELPTRSRARRGWLRTRCWSRSRRPGAVDLPIEAASIERIDAGDVVVALRAVHRSLAALWNPARQRDLAERLFVEMTSGRIPAEFDEARIMALTGWNWQTLHETPADVVDAMTTYLSVRQVREQGGEMDFSETVHAR